MTTVSVETLSTAQILVRMTECVSAWHDLRRNKSDFISFEELTDLCERLTWESHRRGLLAVVSKVISSVEVELALSQWSPFPWLRGKIPSERGERFRNLVGYNRVQMVEFDEVPEYPDDQFYGLLQPGPIADVSPSHFGSIISYELPLTETTSYSQQWQEHFLKWARWDVCLKYSFACQVIADEIQDFLFADSTNVASNAQTSEVEVQIESKLSSNPKRGPKPGNRNASECEKTIYQLHVEGKSNQEILDFIMQTGKPCIRQKAKGHSSITPKRIRDIEDIKKTVKAMKAQAERDAKRDS